MACHPRRGQNVEDLFNCPWFFGEISRETAIQILNEDAKNYPHYGQPWAQKMLFLETVSNDIGQNRFAIIQGSIRNTVWPQPILKKVRSW